MIVYINGKLVPPEDAHFDPWDRGLTLGDGLFETIRVHAGVAQRVFAHLNRLAHGAGVLGIPLTMSEEDLVHAIAVTIRENGVEGGVARLTLTRGPAPRGIAPPEKPTPTLMIVAEQVLEQTTEPVHAIIATKTRRNEFSPLAGLKTLNYLDNIIARQEAIGARAHDALLLNSIGAVVEATTANLFVAIEGQILTPPIKDGALPGIMRADVIQATGAVEQTLAPHAFAQISEAFLTNSLGIAPLIQVDDQVIGDGKPGPVCTRLQQMV
ncbi:MAG: aminotransferase class IV [Rhodospirillales bacterium]